jgi:membrane-bound serine protease (ClpP class)
LYLSAMGAKAKISTMSNPHRKIAFLLLCLLLLQLPVLTAEPNNFPQNSPPVKAAVIVCKGMIDNGLYKSIQRRTQIALDAGAEYLIYEISTYGGLLESADDISKYFILDVAKRAHTVAYITTEAISAGAMISVSCQDIIMLENTTIGDCAPIQIGAKLEGVEREKTESFTRAAFTRAAEANRYPAVLLKAMVSMGTKIYRLKNLKTGDYEFFESERLPNDANSYDLAGKELIVKENELLTLTASKALEYGIARAQVKELAGALDFLAKRDGVIFVGEPIVLKTSWSEEMVRWLNSPAVMAVLVMLALLGVYIEFSTPGVILPGLVAVICFVIIVGSKYLVGMANWMEVALFILGIILLLVEIFILPGFGAAGILGIALIFFGLFGMLIKNPPDKLPWPQTQYDWQLFTNGALGLLFGFFGFVLLAWLVTKHLPKIPVARRLMLAAPQEPVEIGIGDSKVAARPSEEMPVEVGQKGISLSQLRPAGKAKFGGLRLDVVSGGELIEADREIVVEVVEGNRIVVKEIPKPKNTR